MRTSTRQKTIELLKKEIGELEDKRMDLVHRLNEVDGELTRVRKAWEVLEPIPEENHNGN